MQDFAGRVAVVTGAASGIGRSLVERCAAEGMSVVLADVDAAGLSALEEQLRSAGAQALAVPTDVTQQAQVTALADAAEAAYGRIHLLFNNAGVLQQTGPVWEVSDEDWQWVLGVNLWGVIHGLRAFVPRMLAHAEPAHVVNTASVGGLLVGPAMVPYLVSKHAVVALSEAMFHQLAGLEGVKLRVSVLCPGGVATRIADSERVRPAELGGGAPVSEARRRLSERLGRDLSRAMPPAQVAESTFQAIREERFWVLPDPSFEELLQERTRGMCSGTNPVYSGRMG